MASSTTGSEHLWELLVGSTNNALARGWLVNDGAAELIQAATIG